VIVKYKATHTSRIQTTSGVNVTGDEVVMSPMVLYSWLSTGGIKYNSTRISLIKHVSQLFLHLIDGGVN